MVPPELYGYAAKLHRVVDGDTVRFYVDLGFRVQTTSVPCRLQGINAPELDDPGGQAAKGFVESRLGPAAGIRVRSMRLDKYGRPLVRVYYQDGDRAWHDLNQDLVDAGLAQPVA